MNTLKLISEQPPDQSFNLEPGVTTVGRLEDNQIQITHPTISSRHCELHLADGTLLVKDLHSTNGTFINEQPIADEGPLKPGDVLRLGNVRLLYEGPGNTAVRVDPGAARLHAATPEFASTTSQDHGRPGLESMAIDAPCHKHPRVQAEYLCTGCRTKLCEACVRKRESGTKKWLNCTLCGSKVVTLADWHAQQAVREAREHLTLPQRLGGAFAYPLAKGGLTFILLGAFILWLAEVARLFVAVVPLYGWVALIILLTFSYGWVFSYVQKIVVSCSNDEDVLPEWPEISNWSDDLVQPFLSCLGVMCLCFGPAFVYSVFATANDIVPMFYYPIFILGAIYLPMAVVVVSLTQRVLSANPFVVFPAITKVPRDYLIVCLLFLAALGAWNGLGALVDMFGPPAGKRGFAFERFIWEAGWALPLWVIFLYLLIFCARVAGLMYRCNWRQFGWFKH